MDEMKIVSKFTRGIVSKIVKAALKKKFGYDVDILLNELNVTITDGKTHLHMDVDAELEGSELMKILKNVGVD